MTEQEVIKKAAVAFKKRDKLAAELRQADAEIAELVRAYSLAMKLWGFTPVMLRHAVEARLGKAA
jgi:hypothetical protein